MSLSSDRSYHRSSRRHSYLLDLAASAVATALPPQIWSLATATVLATAVATVFAAVVNPVVLAAVFSSSRRSPGLSSDLLVLVASRRSSRYYQWCQLQKRSQFSTTLVMVITLHYFNYRYYLVVKYAQSQTYLNNNPSTKCTTILKACNLAVVACNKVVSTISDNWWLLKWLDVNANKQPSLLLIGSHGNEHIPSDGWVSTLDRKKLYLIVSQATTSTSHTTK